MPDGHPPALVSIDEIISHEKSIDRPLSLAAIPRPIRFTHWQEKGEGMTRGQIAQLQDLSKCYLRYYEDMFVSIVSEWSRERLNKYEKAFIRRLTHLYRHQIAAVKRNQKQ